MGVQGSLPPASVYGSWIENIEVRSTEDDTLYDFSGVAEIKLILFCPSMVGGSWSGFSDLTLTLSKGEITLPSPGIIQWRASQGMMGRLYPGLYQVVLQLDDGTDTVPLILGEVSVVG